MMIFINRKYLLIIIHIAILGCVGQCISPMELSPEEPTSYLVVNGGITNLPGPHIIELSRPLQYDDGIVSKSYKLSAKIHLEDDLGNRILLEPYKTNYYATPKDFRGKIGRTYTLNIKLADGRKYSSLPQKLEPSMDLLRIKVDHFAKKEMFSDNGFFVDQEGKKFSLKLGEETSSNNYYQVKWMLNGLSPANSTYWKNKERRYSNITLIQSGQLTGD
ncbi:DUF4249 family protein [Xanthovirga aplysinae]|uniref:DUF4249 family protein n=1 Tax=Xanthovirga aplysinae TaxID=2529853 RepID=UPI001656F69A|nr:DUF4249 family protein [Xanthovirga aplysinae]